MQMTTIVKTANEHSNDISSPSHHVLPLSQILTAAWIKELHSGNLDHIAEEEHGDGGGLPVRCPANN